jgi:hypothetical protein
VSVFINDRALAALFETEEGPVGRFVRREGEKIVESMKDDVRSYYVGANTGAEDDVALRMDGSTAVIGLQNDPQGRSTSAESKSARYARVGRFEKTRQAVGQ